jgi:hypothetical protein
MNRKIKTNTNIKKRIQQHLQNIKGRIFYKWDGEEDMEIGTMSEFSTPESIPAIVQHMKQKGIFVIKVRSPRIINFNTRTKTFVLKEQKERKSIYLCSFIQYMIWFLGGTNFSKDVILVIDESVTIFDYDLRRCDFPKIRVYYEKNPNKIFPCNIYFQLINENGIVKIIIKQVIIHSLVKIRCEL